MSDKSKFLDNLKDAQRERIRKREQIYQDLQLAEQMSKLSTDKPKPKRVREETPSLLLNVSQEKLDQSRARREANKKAERAKRKQQASARQLNNLVADFGKLSAKDEEEDLSESLEKMSMKRRRIGGAKKSKSKPKHKLFGFLWFVAIK